MMKINISSNKRQISFFQHLKKKNNLGYIDQYAYAETHCYLKLADLIQADMTCRSLTVRLGRLHAVNIFVRIYYLFWGSAERFARYGGNVIHLG